MTIPTNTNSPAPFLTTAELADRWRISPRTLRNQRCAGLGVPSVKIGGAVRYRLADVEAYEAAAPVAYPVSA